MKKFLLALIITFFTVNCFAATSIVTTGRINEAPLLEKMLDQVWATSVTLKVGSESDTVLAAETGHISFRMPYATRLSGVRASVTNAPTADMIIDINEGGTTIFGNYLDYAGSTVRKRLYIQSGSETSKDVYLGTSPTGSEYVITDSDIADDAEITVDIDSTTGGGVLQITFYGQIKSIPSNY